MDSRLQRQESVAGIAHLEDAPEPILGNISYLEDLQLGRHRAQVELRDEYVIDDNRGFGRFIEGRREQVAGSLVELLVGRQRRPVEVEGHVELAVVV